MIGYVILLGLTAAVFWFVLTPLISARRQAAPIVPARLADLQARRTYLLEAIRDVDFDYSLGKTSEAEYQEVRSHYIQEAAEVLREIERESKVVDAEIEQEIAQLQELARNPARPPADAASESEES